MARVYDLIMTHRLDADDFFIHRVQQHCAELNLNFFLIEPVWVEAFKLAMERGVIWARFLLNLHSEHHLPEESFHQLVRLADQRHVRVIDPPEVALAAVNKAQLHGRLIKAGLPVPETVIIAGSEVRTRKLGDHDRAFLGSPFVVKPALGYGKRGVILDATGEADLLRSAEGWPYGDYLLQRRITPAMLAGEPAYFRVFYAFGRTWICWWNCYTDRYRSVEPSEEQRYGLGELRLLSKRVADLTRMQFFSSEIALNESGDWRLIDYVNDQCHMLSQSADPRIGVPDSIVAAIARELVEGVAARIREITTS